MVVTGHILWSLIIWNAASVTKLETLGNKLYLILISLNLVSVSLSP